MTPMSTTITIYHAKERKAITCIISKIVISGFCPIYFTVTFART